MNQLNDLFLYLSAEDTQPYACSRLRVKKQEQFIYLHFHLHLTKDTNSALITDVLRI